MTMSVRSSTARSKAGHTAKETARKQQGHSMDTAEAPQVARDELVVGPSLASLLPTVLRGKVPPFIAQHMCCRTTDRGARGNGRQHSRRVSLPHTVGAS